MLDKLSENKTSSCNELFCRLFKKSGVSIFSQTFANLIVAADKVSWAEKILKMRLDVEYLSALWHWKWRFLVLIPIAHTIIILCRNIFSAFSLILHRLSSVWFSTVICKKQDASEFLQSTNCFQDKFVHQHFMSYMSTFRCPALANDLALVMWE